jgi:hypothetical protein
MLNLLLRCKILAYLENMESSSIRFKEKYKRMNKKQIGLFVRLNLIELIIILN